MLEQEVCSLPFVRVAATIGSLPAQPTYALFNVLASRVVMEPDPGVQAQLVDVVRLLIDCDRVCETGEYFCWR